MWFFYIDNDTNERVLLKTYAVGLGRVDNTSPSGLLTPMENILLEIKLRSINLKSWGTTMANASR